MLEIVVSQLGAVCVGSQVAAALRTQRADQQLNDARRLAAPNLLQVMSQIQDYTASLTAVFAGFTRQSDH